MKIQVKDIQTGQTGFIDDSELSARYQPIQSQRLETKVPVTQTQQDKPSIGGFVGNVVKSGVSTAGGIGSALLNILNPNMEKNTVANLGRLGVGAAELLVPGEQGAEKYARAAGNFYDQRYGISDLLKGDTTAMGKKVGNTLYNDPVGAALDLSAVLGLGGGAVSKLGKLSKMESVANAGANVSKLSRAVDPLQTIGKIINPKIGKVVENTAKSAEEFGTNMPTKILKATAPRVTKFEEVLPKGKTINDFMVENKLVGTGTQAFKKSDELIKIAQKEYNNLARSKTTTINPSDYLSSIDEQIAIIKSSNYTPAAEKIVKELENVKKSFMEGVTANNEVAGIPIDKFTNMKTSTIGRAGKLDPVGLDAERLAGNAMIGVIEKYAPGSAELGKRLQQLREFRDLAAKVPSGRNVNLLGILKPSGTGAAIGAMTFGLPGAVVGAGAGMASQSPAIMKLLGKGGSIIGENLPNIAQKTAGGISQAERAGNLMRLISPGNQENNQKQNNTTDNSQVNTSIAPPSTSEVSQQQSVQPKTLTGYTPEEHIAAYQNALRSGDQKAADKIYALYEKEVTFQGGNNQNQKNEVNDTIDNIDKILGSDLTYATGIIGKTVNIPGTSAYDLKRQIQQVKDQLSLASVGKLKGQGQVSDAEREMLANAATSLDTGMTQEAFRKELENVKTILKRKL